MNVSTIKLSNPILNQGENIHGEWNGILIIQSTKPFSIQQQAEKQLSGWYDRLP